MSGGNYYAYTLRTRPDQPSGPKIARQIGWQIVTPRQGMKLVEESGHPGCVEFWSERTQRRTEYARYRNGHWSARNPYTGLYEPMGVTA